MLKIVVLGMSRGVRTESVDGQSGFTLTRVKQRCHKNLAFRVVGLLVEFQSAETFKKLLGVSQTSGFFQALDWLWYFQSVTHM